MATINSPLYDKMVIKALTGEEVNGQPKLKTITYNYVNTAVTDDDFYAVANAIQALSARAVSGVQRLKTSTITE